MATAPLPALCDAAGSLLVLVDIQDRLIAAMPEESASFLLRNSTILLQAAALLNIPVLVSEQYPEKLGGTVASITQHLPHAAQGCAKTSFSCCGSVEFRDALAAHGRRQIILAGMETHVCVLQSALELHASGLQVFVIEDAVCSRTQANSSNALARMREAGIIISSTESVLFEWLRNANHEHFKQISALIR